MSTLQQSVIEIVSVVTIVLMAFASANIKTDTGGSGGHETGFNNDKVEGIQPPVELISEKTKPFIDTQKNQSVAVTTFLNLDEKQPEICWVYENDSGKMTNKPIEEKYLANRDNQFLAKHSHVVNSYRF